MTRPQPLPDGDARRRAATAFDANLVVVAGAGTGKTSLLVERFLNLALGGGLGTTDPEPREGGGPGAAPNPFDGLVAITFTEKAAAEMRDRVADAIDRVLALARAGENAPADDTNEAGRVWRYLREGAGLDPAAIRVCARAALDHIDTAAVSTIHSFCADLLRRHAIDAGVPLEFMVDEGLGQDLLFDDLWPAFFAEAVGPRAPQPDIWTAVLERFTETEVEETARAVALNPVAGDLLARFGYVTIAPQEHFGELARELREDLVAHRGELVGRTKMPAFMDTAILLLDRFAGGGSAALREAAPTDLPLPEFWDRKEVFSAGPEKQLGERKAVIEDRAREALKLLQALRGIDEAALELLLGALRPFAARFRERILGDGVLSFEDLLLLARNVLAAKPEVRRHEARRARAILVDEFQDTDPLQYEIVFLLAAEPKDGEIVDPYAHPLEPGRLFIVGDPKQSIYRFRGADMAAFDGAQEHVLEGSRPEKLTANFRSLPEVLDPVNTLFAPWMEEDTDRRIQPEYGAIEAQRPPAGDPRVELWSVSTREGTRAEIRRAAEARAIAREILAWRGEDPDGRSLKHVALLFRALGDVPLYAREFRRAGVEFVLDGGKAFTERPEVNEAMALLEALANPADPVAALAVARSAFGGADDAELAAFAAAGGRFHWPSVNVPPEAARAAPTVVAAFRRVRELALRTRRLPIDRRIQVVLTESDFTLVQAAYVEGPQRMANVRKLAERAAAVARDRGLTLEESLRTLRDEFTGSRNEGESPLADEAVNAVRFLTIHKAKGLEFPLVFLPDVARGTRGGIPETRAGVFRRDRITVALEGRARLRNTAAVAAEMENARHEEAENKRLLYVAMTRAKDRLVLVNSAVERTGPWVKAIQEHWGYGIGNKHDENPFPDDGARLAGGEVRHRRILEEPARDVAGAEPRGETVTWARAFAEAAEAAQTCARPSHRTPSADRRAETIEAVPEGDREPAVRARELGRAAGNAVHLALEHADFAHPESALRELAAAVPGCASAPAPTPDDVLGEATRILEGFLASELPARLAAAEILGREVPILLRDEEGVTVHGYADLVYRAGGRVHVADYKTDAGPSAEAAEKYRPQLADYAAAVQRALGLDDPPVAELLMIRRGERVVL